MPPHSRNRTGREPSAEPQSRAKPQSTKKKPLQDITERYIEEQRSRQNSPVKQRTLGKKKKATNSLKPDAVELSSLPPSSPRSAVSISSDAENNIEEQDAEEVEAEALVHEKENEKSDAETLPYFSSDRLDPSEIPKPQPEPFHHLSDVENFEFNLDDEMYLNDPPPHPEEAETTVSDPFGFTAVENKLKAGGAARPRPALPAASIMFTKKDGRFPPTPHKQRIRKRKASSSPDPLDGDQPLDFQPSSPSPVKPSASKRRSVAVAPVDLSFDEAVTPQAPRRGTRTRPPSKKLRESVAVDLSSSPPRAPDAPHPRKIIAPRSTSGSSRSKSMKPASRGAGSKARLRKVLPDDEEDEEDSPDAAAERQKRIDYYKQLMEYTVAEERVYVI